MDVFSPCLSPLFPDETLHKIFGYLDGNQLAKCSSVCRRFHAIVEDDIHWKSRCEIDWLISDLTDSFSMWKLCYIDMYRRYGRYVNCYRRVKRCWEKIFAVTQERCPPIYNSLLRDGASEECLDELQTKIGIHAKLPLEYRCSYRLCNGQESFRFVDAFGNHSHAGLFGSYDVVDLGDYMCRCPDAEEMDGLAFFRWCCLWFVYIIDNRLELPDGRLALCVRDSAASEARRNCEHDAEHDKLEGRVVSVSKISSRRMELFICGNTFVDFLEDFANRICDFPVVSNRFLKFDFNSAEETGPFTVTVRTAFFRNRSRAFPLDNREFQFFYRITMSMHPDAPRCDSCQLVTRHWIITNADGKVTISTEMGGNELVLRPGTEFSWISRIGFATTVGKISGYFTMRKVNDEGEIRINCPEFVMVAQAAVEAYMRKDSWGGRVKPLHRCLSF